MDRMIREKERRLLTGICRSTWWRWSGKGLAPKAVRLGPSARGWPESVIRRWLEEKREASETQ